jgi:hypothetical protein
MSNLKLVADDPTPLEKLLLEASRAEQPSSEHKARLRVALGLGLPGAVPPLTNAPSPDARVAPPDAVFPAAGKSLAFGKVAAASIGALALVGAWALSRESIAPPASTAVAPSPVVVQPAARSTAPAGVEPVSPSGPLPAESPRPEAAQGPGESARRAVTRSAVSPSSSADLSEQIRLIEAARAGVAGREPKAALAALDAYSTKYPRGAFGQEATVLRIRALDQGGDSARATALAKSFIARFPQSPHVARLKPIAERGASR